MKCTSCVSSSRPKSDDDDDNVDGNGNVQDDNGGVVSPVRAMDKIEEEYRVESPPTVQPTSSKLPPPSVSIVEVPPDYRGESSRIYDIGLEKQPSPSASSSSHLLRPLDVIAEENSDVSDTESRPAPPRMPNLCFQRPKSRFKKAKSRNLLKSLLQVKQEPTTCVLLDTKIAEAAPEEYRSVCTTEVVPEEILEVEVIDLGSNSSSLADLTDLDDGELDQPIGDVITTAEVCDNFDQINNNEYGEENTADGGGIVIDSANECRKPHSPSPSASPPPNQTDNDNEIDSESCARPPPAQKSKADHAEEERRHETEEQQEEEYSEEDNNGYGEDENEEGESKTSEIFTQPPQQQQAVNASTQNDDDGGGFDDDRRDDDCYRSDDDDYGEYHENDRTESDRDDELGGSLLAGVDRAGVVTQQQRNVIEVKECIDEKNGDDVDEKSSIDCCVTHPNCSNRSGEGEEEVRPAIGDSAVQSATITTTSTAEMGESPEVEVVPKPPPLPTAAALAAAAPAVAEAPASAAAVTNLGQDVSCDGPETVTASENAQIHSGSDTGEVDSANADPDSAQDSVNAVVVGAAASSSRGDSEESVLLKFLQDQPPSPPLAEASVENRPTFDEPSPPRQPEQNSPVAATKIERTVKSEQLNYEIVQDHRLVRREETVTTSAASSNNNNNTEASGGSEVVLRRRGSKSSNSGKEPSPEQKAALVHDLRNEISRIKDAELQEEFRKLELEAARIEQELSQMTIIPAAAPLQVPSMTENLTYYVSKQNDFAVVQKPPVMTTPNQPPPKPTNGSVAKSTSNDQLYNEWQQKMEEREARRLHKVIKISKPNEPAPLPPPVNGTANGSAPEPDPDLGDEFLRKVKERRRKFTLPGGSDSEQDNSAPSSAPGTPIAGRKPVPKHIEAEFAQFAELRKRQQQEEAQEQQQQTSAGESSSKEEDKSVDRKSPSMLVLASAIGIVVWSVFRVMFGRK